METAPSWISVLPNLSIGVVSIVGLVYVVLKFLAALDSRSDKHEAAMNERENALRQVESSVRITLTEHIAQASVALRENTKILERVVRHLDGTKE